MDQQGELVGGGGGLGAVPSTRLGSVSSYKCDFINNSIEGEGGILSGLGGERGAEGERPAKGGEDPDPCQGADSSGEGGSREEPHHTLAPTQIGGHAGLTTDREEFRERNQQELGESHSDGVERGGIGYSS